MILMQQMMACCGVEPGGATWPNHDWYTAGGVNAADVIAAYQPKGAPSTAQSYENLTGDSTFDITRASIQDPALTANGWFFSGTNDEVLDSHVSRRNYNSGFSAIVKYSEVSGPFVTYGGYLLGSSFTGLRCMIVSRPEDSQVLAGNGTSYSSISATSTGDVAAIAGSSFYLSSVVAASIDNSDVFVDGSLGIGGHLDASGIGGGALSGVIEAIAFYGTNLTVQQVSEITNAMNAL